VGSSFDRLRMSESGLRGADDALGPLLALSLSKGEYRRSCFDSGLRMSVLTEASSLH
jgi:hypothetical protein